MSTGKPAAEEEMSSIGTGYDLAAATFSPDDRICQAEDAQKAVDNSSGTMIALRGRDGVVTAVDKLIVSKLSEESIYWRVSSLDVHMGVAMAGLYPDCRALLDYALAEALDYAKEYGGEDPVPCGQLAAKIADRVINHPFGCSLFLSAWDPVKGAQLYLIEPTSGLSYERRAGAVGKHRQAAMTEIKKLKLEDLGMDELVQEAARIILTVRDETKDKNGQIEMGWVGRKTNGYHRAIPADVAKAAEEWAKKKIEDDA